MLTGGTPKSAGFEMQIPRPVDYKTWTDSLVKRNATPVKYEGMTIYVKKDAADPESTGKKWKLKPLDECALSTSPADYQVWGTRNSDWTIDGGSSANGWSPVLSLVAVGEKLVYQVSDWTGGVGTKPAVGLYVTGSGLSNDPALSINVKGVIGPEGPAGPRGLTGPVGPQGIDGKPFNIDEQGLLSGRTAYNLFPAGFTYLAIDTGNVYIKASNVDGDWGPPVSFVGDRGWSPVLAIVGSNGTGEVSIAGALYQVFKITGWVNGEGQAPAANVYITPTGTSTNIALAVNIKGESITGPAGPIGPQGIAGDPGSQGTSAYVTVGYADDLDGANFSLSPGNRNYIAFKITSTPIEVPSASNFTGLWKQYAGNAVGVNDGVTNETTPWSGFKVNSELALKVDKILGMGLSANDLSNVLKAGYDLAVLAAHNHNNKALLDTYTQTEADLADAIAKKHAHANKALLDSYTQTETNLAGAVTDRHTHANKAVLDAITSGKTDNWDAAYAHLSDAIRHLTAQERLNWDAAFTHISDAVKHITAEERTLWNGVTNQMTVNTEQNVTAKKTFTVRQAFEDATFGYSGTPLARSHVRGASASTGLSQLVENSAGTELIKAENNGMVTLNQVVTTASVSGAVSLDLSLSNVWRLTLTGNITSFDVTNLVAGRIYRVYLIQDATGYRTIAGMAAKFKTEEGRSILLSTAASAVDLLQLEVETASLVGVYPIYNRS